MKRILGIDPGQTGAFVVLHDGEPVEWGDMPVMKVGSSTRINCSAFATAIENLQIDFAVVELVHSFPGQGVASSFSFGHSVGCIMGVLGAMGVPHTLVTPQAWKKAAGLIGTDKDAARARAIQLWPSWRELDKKGKGQALADAALIARHGS